MQRYSRTAVPSTPTGAPLNRAREWLEIIVPQAGENLFLNPSFEVDSANWTASSDGSNGTPYARTAAAQFRGTYAAILTIRPTGGTYVQLVGPAVVASTLYSVSFHVKRPNRGPIRSSDVRAVVNGAPVEFDRIVYVGDGWWRCEKSYTASGTDAPGIRVLGAPGAIFYVDGCQLEEGGTPTTYIDGDQLGLSATSRIPAYLWTGAPHASTSVRSALTRAGGKPVNVARYGLTILALIGLGFSQRTVIATPLGLLDGSLYQRTIRESRVFTVAGAFEAPDPRTLSAQRGALRALLTHDLTGTDRPLLMRLQRHQGREAIGDQTSLTVSYLEGLGEDMGQVFDEKVSVQFQQHLPLLAGGASRGATVAGNASVSNANRVIYRTAGGQWTAMGSGINNSQANEIVQGPDGLLYVIGTFTTAGGSVADAVALWNPNTQAWAALDTGTVNQAITGAFDAAGNFYLGGNFASVFGTAAANIAMWDGSSWSALGAGVNSTVQTIAVGPDGAIYAAGDFTTAGGGAAARIARWDGSSWSALGSGLNNTVSDLGVGLDGDLYASGFFTQAGGNTANRIAKWDGSAWSPLGTGMDAQVLKFDFDEAGNLYAVGAFTTADGISASRAAVWNGVAWQAMGSGLNGTANEIRYDRQTGALIAVGAFTAADGITTPDGAAQWNGSSWGLVDVDLPGSPSITALMTTAAGEVYFGYNTAGSAVAPIVTELDNPGTAPSSLTIVITAPAAASTRLYSVTNYTTGRTIYLDCTLFAGERATLTADSFSSNFRPSLNGTILPGSDPQALELAPGANQIAAYAADDDTVFDFSFTPQYESLDDLTMRAR